MTPMNAKCHVMRLGRVDYDETVTKQMELVERVQADKDLAYLLLLSHNHVFTIGRFGSRDNILASEDILNERGVIVRRTRRGGDITYHGPGQIIGYPILSLSRRRLNIRKYFSKLESLLISVLSRYGIEGRCDDDYPGAWVGEEKVAALGVGISKWVAFHGFALNVNTDLSHFDMIVPCGIAHRRVTSMAKILGRSLDEEEVTQAVEEGFLNEFDFEK